MLEEQNKAPQIRVTEYKNGTGNLSDDLKNRPVNKGVPKWVIWLVILVAVLLIGGVFALYVKSQSQINSLKKDLNQQQTDPTVKAKEESKQLIDEVGKLIILPVDENPTIATVSDLSKLKDQPFFNSAQIGDKVLIYSKAQKAILFRPSEHKIIELAPLSSSATNNSSATANTSTQSTQTPQQ